MDLHQINYLNNQLQTYEINQFYRHNRGFKIIKMNANSFKFKHQQKNSPFFANFQSSNADSKYHFLKSNKPKKLPESIKLQSSHQQSTNLTRKNRYDTFEDTEIRNKNIKSLSLERKSQLIRKSQDKVIFFKKSSNNNKKILQTSLQSSKKSLSPYSNKNKRSLLNKKLTILNNESIGSPSKDSKKSIKHRYFRTMDIENVQKNKPTENKRKFRVKSTFCKLESLQMGSSALYQSSSKTLTGRYKTIQIEKKPSKTSIEVVKVLVKSQQYKKALILIKDIFSQKNYIQNVQLLQLFINCMYNLQEYDEVTKIFDNVSNVQKKWSSQIYVMVCLSFAKHKTYKKSLQVIDKATQMYAQNPQIFYYKGKILYHMKKYDSAQEAFKISNHMHSLPQTLICLADCYRKTNKKVEELSIIESILQSQKSNFHVKYEDLFIRKCKLLFETQKLQDLIKELQNFKKSNKTIKKVQNKGFLEFVYAFSKYNLDQIEIAHDKFQDCLTCQYYQKQSLKMLITLQIKSRNFYEAYRLCSQTNKKQSLFKSDQILLLLTSFVQGSINLVRRNFKQGIEILSHLQLSMQNQEYKKYQSQNQYNDFQQSSDQEAFWTVKNLLHLFLSYGLFSIGQYQFCQSAISKQRRIFNDPKYEKNMNYNYKLCDAILSFQAKQYEEVLQFLDEADEIYPQRMEVYFYRAVVLLKLLLKSIQKTNNPQILQSQEGEKTITLIKANFQECLNKVSSTANNTKATILYYKSLFHAYLKEWKHAVISIDSCITQSDESYWRYYYCKGMILACVHNFQQAIAELNVAINFSDGLRPQCFLLRSRCLQIQGKGNQAFFDLQQYIALKPDDDRVHKYAGQILFENGAFQDALTAFRHQQIPETQENFDIYLTLSKTLFLTGKFNQAQQKMNIAFKLRPQQTQIQFDAVVIKVLDQIIKIFNSDKIKDNKKQLQKKVEESFSLEQQRKGKIFHQCDYYLFLALIDIYFSDYLGAIQNFLKHLSKKKKMIIFDDNQTNGKEKNIDINTEQQYQKISKQLKIYSNQMKFNIAVCYLANGDIEKAKSSLKQIKIDKKENFYQSFSKFRLSIFNYTFLVDDEEILPNKNKLSQFIPPIKMKIKQKNVKLKVKICIPFPKVEPPQIFPTFDQNLLKTLTIFGIEGKAEAPWIVKEDNVIKFTQKISYASRLDFNDSQPSDSRTVVIDLQNSQLRQKKQINENSRQKSSLFSRRTLKNKNSMRINF